MFAGYCAECGQTWLLPVSDITSLDRMGVGVQVRFCCPHRHECSLLLSRRGSLPTAVM